MRIIATFAILLLVSMPGWPAARTYSKTASHKGKKSAGHKSASPPARASAPRSSRGKTAARRSPSSRKRTAAGKKGAKSTQTARQSWRSGQTVPSSDRYREIQQALIAKGYSSEEATGLWGPQWTDALKRFQSSQNLEPTGKLDSLSLIGLGLGPKREVNAATGISSVKPPGEHP